jgi:methoxymalonate biosynthesis protein
MTQTAVQHRLAVVGAGVMGTGLATLAVGHGVPVLLADIDERALGRARQQVAQQLKLAQLMGKLPREQAAGELITTTDLADIAPATAVIESVIERPKTKAEVLAAASGVVHKGTPVMSGTSAIPIEELADSVAWPADFLGAHFMNPPYMIRTVEVIRGPRTGDAAVAAALSLLSVLGQEAIVVGDGPGFVINRVLQRMINEAARIVEQDVAPPKAVDALFTGCLGHRSGPLGTADLIGLDNVVDSLQVLLDRTGDQGYRPCELLLAKVKAGDLGRKTGRGFFNYGGAQ